MNTDDASPEQKIAQLYSEIAAIKQAKAEEQLRSPDKSGQPPKMTRQEREILRQDLAKAERAKKKADKIAAQKLDGSYGRRAEAAARTARYRQSKKWLIAKERQRDKYFMQKAEKTRLKRLQQQFALPATEGADVRTSTVIVESIKADIHVPLMGHARVMWLFPAMPEEHQLAAPAEHAAMVLRSAEHTGLHRKDKVKIGSFQILALPDNPEIAAALTKVLPKIVPSMLTDAPHFADNTSRPMETEWLVGSDFFPQVRAFIWATPTETAASPAPTPQQRTERERQEEGRPPRHEYRGPNSKHTVQRRNWCRLVRILSEDHLDWVLIGGQYWLDMLKAAGIDGNRPDLQQRETGYRPEYPHSIVKAPDLNRSYAPGRVRYFVLHKFRMPDIDDPSKDFWTASFAPLDIREEQCMCNNTDSNERYRGADMKRPVPIRAPYLVSSGHDSVACQTKSAPHIIAAPSPCINLTEYDVIRARTLDRAYPSIEMMARVQQESVTFNRLINKPDDWRPPANAREADR